MSNKTMNKKTQNKTGRKTTPQPEPVTLTKDDQLKVTLSYSFFNTSLTVEYQHALFF